MEMEAWCWLARREMLGEGSRGVFLCPESFFIRAKINEVQNSARFVSEWLVPIPDMVPAFVAVLETLLQSLTSKAAALHG